MSNLAWSLGPKTQADILRDVGEGILDTTLIGGNSNGAAATTPSARRASASAGGECREPVSEMNIAGDMLDLPQKLVAVGNDPLPALVGAHAHPRLRGRAVRGSLDWTGRPV
jgi:PmbA protein